MTNKTLIAELRSHVESAADCGFIHNVSIDGRLLASLLDQLEAAEARNTASTNQINSLFERVSGESVSSYDDDKLLWLADIIEGELDATEGALNNMRTRAEKAEAEIAKLKGDAVPLPENIPCPSAPDFAWLQTNGDDSDESSWPVNNPDEVSWCVDKVFRNDILYVRSDLFTHAQPVPVVRAEHATWSQETFGNVGPVGPLKHLSKEAIEAAEAPDDLSEWADMQFLFWDAQRRAGITDAQIEQAMIEKLAINKARIWPEPKDGEPRLHVKSADGEGE